MKKLGYLATRNEFSNANVSSQMNELNSNTLATITQNLGYNPEQTYNTGQTPRF